MPTLSVNKTYQDGEYLTEQQLDDAFQSIETFLNITGIGSDNIQDNSIGAAEIQIGSVSETKLASNAVTTPKILDGAVTLAKLADALKVFLVPTGSFMPYGGDTAPSGFLLCDGSTVSRAAYAQLFAVFGVRFGSGDGTTTFNLPDFRGRVLRMIDAGSGRDPDVATRTAMNTGGATGGNVGSVQEDELKSHTHPTIYDAVAHTYGGGGLGGSPGIASAWGTASEPTGSRGGSETRMKNAYVNFIVKI